MRMHPVHQCLDVLRFLAVPFIVFGQREGRLDITTQEVALCLAVFDAAVTELVGYLVEIAFVEIAKLPIGR